MSTMTLDHSLDISRTPNLPSRRPVKVELRKTYDTRAGRWLLISMGVLTALVMAIPLAVALLNSVAAIALYMVYSWVLPLTIDQWRVLRAEVK